MPALPQYTSQENITTNLPAPERHLANAPFEDIKQVSDALQGITQQWSNVTDATQEAGAKASYQTTAAKILAAQSQDTGITMDKNGNPTFIDKGAYYAQQLRAAQDNALEGISNDQVKTQLSLELKQATDLNAIKIKSDFQSKQLDFNKTQIPVVLTTDQNIIADQKSTEAQRLQAAIHSQDFINKQVTSGTITIPEGRQALESAQEAAVIGQVYGDKSLKEEDSSLISELKKTDGNYAYLRPETRDKVLKIAKQHIEDNVKVNIESQLKNRVNVLSNIANKQIGWQGEEQIKNLAHGDSKFENALQSVFNAKEKGGEYVPSSAKNDDYSDSVGKIFSAMNKQEISDYLLDAIKDKDMTEDRLAIIVNAADDRAKALPTKGVTDISPTQASIDGGYKAVERWNNMHGNKDTQVLDDYMKAIHDNKSPVEAYQTATNTHKVKKNPLMTQYQMGALVTNPKTGEIGEVVGYTEDGAPLIKRKHGKPKPESKPTEK